MKWNCQLSRFISFFSYMLEMICYSSFVMTENGRFTPRLSLASDKTASCGLAGSHFSIASPGRQTQLEGHMLHHVALVRVSQQSLHLRLGHHPALACVVLLDGVFQRLVLQGHWHVLGALPQEPILVSSFILHAQSDVSVLELTCGHRTAAEESDNQHLLQTTPYTFTTRVITTNAPT